MVPAIVIVLGLFITFCSLAGKRVYDRYPRPNPDDDEETRRLHERWLRLEHMNKVWLHRTFAAFGLYMAFLGVRELLRG